MEDAQFFPQYYAYDGRNDNQLQVLDDVIVCGDEDASRVVAHVTPNGEIVRTDASDLTDFEIMRLAYVYLRSEIA